MKRFARLAVASAVLGIVVMPSVLSSAGPAMAHENLHGWWNCTQKTRTLSDPVYIGVESGAYAFPAAGSGDGVTNSFTDRIADAAKAWDYHVRASAGQPYGVGYAGANPAVNIVVRYRSIDPGLYGFTYIPGNCITVHGTNTPMPAKIYIDINRASDWFTQDDSRRGLWENCPSAGYTPSYTCSKTMDVGSTITHEIGHALGLSHPAQVDDHLGGGTSSRNLAQCFAAKAQSTMCSASDVSTGGAYRTHRRTLDPWDVKSLGYALP